MDNPIKRAERRSITFYLLRGLKFQNRSTERNSFAMRTKRAHSLMQLKIKRDRRSDVHRLTRGRKWSHTPLLHRCDRCFGKRRRAAKDFVNFDAPVFLCAHL